MKTNYGVQIEGELLDRARAIAQEEHRSLNGQLVFFIERGIRLSEEDGNRELSTRAELEHSNMLYDLGIKES